MRPQPDVDAKDAFLFGYDPAQELLRQPFEVFAVFNSLLPACFARSSVDEQDLDVRSVAELTPSEFSQSHDGQGTGFPVVEPWAPVGFFQLRATICEASFHDDLRQFRER